MFEVARFNMKVNKFILISALLLVTRVQIIASLASQCKISSLSPKFNVSVTLEYYVTIRVSIVDSQSQNRLASLNRSQTSSVVVLSVNEA